MIDILRGIRNAVYSISRIEIYGISIDFLLHFFVAFVAIFVFQRFISLKKSIYCVATLIVLKEAIDIFAKSRMEYIRPPTQDFIVDVTLGSLGVATAVWIIHRKKRKDNGGNRESEAERMGPRILSVVLAAICLLLLVQGIYHSTSQFLFGGLSIITALGFFFIKTHRGALGFFLVPFGPLINMSRFSTDSYLYNIEVCLLTYFFLWFLWSFKRLQISGNQIKLYLLFLATLVPGVILRITSPDVVAEIRLVRGLFIGLCLVFYVNNMGARAIENCRHFLKATLVVCACVVFFGTAEVVLKLSIASAPKSLFGNSEMLAIYLALSLPIVLSAYKLLNRSLYSYLSMVTFGVGCLVILATRSRISIVALTLTGFLYLLMTKKEHSDQKRRIKIAIGMAVAAVVAIAVTVHKTIQVSGSTSGTLEELTKLIIGPRIDVWQTGLQHIFASPLLGEGTVVNVYNLFLQLGASFGLPAAVVFLLLLYFNLRKTRGNEGTISANQTVVTGLFFGIVSLLVTSVAESTWGNQLAYLNFFVLFLVGAKSRLIGQGTCPREF